jgi:hypothetical protein
MASLFDTLHRDAPNPLDNIEDILTANDWAFNRMADNELSVTLSGKYCTYHLFFIWQADMTALQINVQYELSIHPLNLGKAGSTLMTINENTWMGHFEIANDTCIPAYRYTTLLNPENKQSYEQLENIVDIALAQCETNYAAFSLLTAENAANDETLPLALMQTQGAS